MTSVLPVSSMPIACSAVAAKARITLSFQPGPPHLAVYLVHGYLVVIVPGDAAHQR